jgi:hypothetical protein
MLQTLVWNWLKNTTEDIIYDHRFFTEIRKNYLPNKFLKSEAPLNDTKIQFLSHRKHTGILQNQFVNVVERNDVFILRIIGHEQIHFAGKNMVFLKVTVSGICSYHTDLKVWISLLYSPSVREEWKLGVKLSIVIDGIQLTRTLQGTSRRKQFQHQQS